MTPYQTIEPLLEHFVVTVDQVRSKSRKRRIATCRHFCIAALTETTDMSSQEIADYFKRERSTMNNSIERLKDFRVLRQYKRHCQKFESILSEIRAYVDPMPDEIGFDEMYLNLVILEP